MKINSHIEIRVLSIAQDLINTRMTVRQLAKVHMISKSTVHKDITIRLKYLNEPLYSKCAEILEEHKQIRHIRGGEKTKEKWERLRCQGYL